jgi:hypothetical protein
VVAAAAVHALCWPPTSKPAGSRALLCCADCSCLPVADRCAAAQEEEEPCATHVTGTTAEVICDLLACPMWLMHAADWLAG